MKYARPQFSRKRRSLGLAIAPMSNWTQAESATASRVPELFEDIYSY